MTFWQLQSFMVVICRGQTDHFFLKMSLHIVKVSNFSFENNNVWSLARLIYSYKHDPWTVMKYLSFRIQEITFLLSVLLCYLYCFSVILHEMCFVFLPSMTFNSWQLCNRNFLFESKNLKSRPDFKCNATSTQK